MKKTKRVLVVLGFLLLCSYVFAEVINVPADEPTIQQGINAAANGDTVLVQPGTYVENINYNEKSIVLGSLFLTTGNPAYITETIIDGNNQERVVIIENVSGTTAVLCGFMIINGYNYATAWDGGGGICCLSSNITLKDLIVSNNTAVMFGGGIQIDYNSNAIVENVTVKNNNGYAAGGMAVFRSVVSLTNVKILNNSCTVEGGGIDSWESDLTIENAQISGNNAAMGGGLAVSSPVSLIMNNVMISDNYAEGWGGGLLINGDAAEPMRISNSVIKGNACNDDIDGIGAGVMSVNDANLELTNVTITENSCFYEAAAHYLLSGSEVTYTNCVLWNNTPGEIIVESINDPSIITISYSDIQGGEAGIDIFGTGVLNWLEGNIDEDPLFAFTGEHHYSLLEDSPSINTGIPDITGLNLPEFDFAGNPRVLDGRIEMGAYEFTTLISTDFTASYTEGSAPFNVEFSDLTSGYPTEWEWDFDDDGVIDSYDQDPVWTYEEPGDYTVTLTSSNAYNEDTEIKESYIHVTEGVSVNEDTMPTASKLIGNYPNPFNPSTTISFNLTAEDAENAELVIYNIKGQKVKQFSDIRNQTSVVWNGIDSNNQPVSSGIYFYKLKTGNFEQTRKMILMK